jgi:large subunit ribosomal protein L10
LGSTAALEAKKSVVQEIVEKVKEAQSVVLVDYRGLNVDEATELRRKYSEANVDYTVYKNSLMSFAFKECGYEELVPYLKGPNAIAISKDDSVIAAKISQDFSKAHKNLELKAGMVDGKVLNLEEITKIASLPSREILLTQIAIGLNAPMSKTAQLLQALVEKRNAEQEQ